MAKDAVCKTAEGAEKMGVIKVGKKIKCDTCGKEFEPGNRPDGLPNGVGFITKEGKKVNYCFDCMVKQGQEAKNRAGKSWEGETQDRKCFVVACTMPLPWVNMEKADQFVRGMTTIKGLIGVHPSYPNILLAFDTLENAIRGRETAQEQGEKAAEYILNARIEAPTGTLVIGEPAWQTGSPRVQ